MNSEQAIAVITTHIEHIRDEIAEIKVDVKDLKHSISNRYVKKEEFEPIKKLAYGLVTLIITIVVAGLISLVIK